MKSKIRIAHTLGGDCPDELSDQIYRSISVLPRSVNMHRLASLCVAYPRVMARCGHLIESPDTKTASDMDSSPISDLFKFADQVSQSELTQRGNKLKRFQGKAPRGEGKQIDRRQKSLGGSIPWLKKRIPKYDTLSPQEKSQITKKIIKLLRGNKKRRQSPKVKQFTMEMDKANNINNPREKNQIREKLLKRWLGRAEAEVEKRQNQQKKKEKSEGGGGAKAPSKPSTETKSKPSTPKDAPKVKSAPPSVFKAKN